MLASRSPYGFSAASRRVVCAVPYLEDPPLAFAHRGGAADGDENTQQAFARAVAAGYRYVEIDVHATADGVAVVVHDPDLLRVAGRPAPVAAVSFQALQGVSLTGGGAVPRLDDVLAGWPQVKFNIDVKSDRAVQPTLEAVQRAGAAGRVLLASFSDTRIARIRVLSGGAVATALARREAGRLWLASRLGGWPGRTPVVPASAVAVQVPPRYGRLRVVDRRLVTTAHRLGLQVHVWTIDDPTEMAGLLDLGVDGIMTDRIQVLREVFLERGLWR
jgi:glycerophosphoryl diester phosphodiesterase